MSIPRILKLIEINPEDRTLVYKVFRFSIDRCIEDIVFLLFTFGLGILFWKVMPFGDRPPFYEYFCTIRGYSRKSIEKYVREKFD